MKSYSGIDEAGLGPILGPYCATLITIEAEKDLNTVIQQAQKKIFYVDDSKKVYQGKYGFKRLEEQVLAFYYLLNNRLPENTKEFIPSLRTEWYTLFPVDIPHQANRDEIINISRRIKTFFSNNNITLKDIKRTAISAENFNHLISEWDNKSIVCQKILNPLLIHAYSYRGNIVVDKQGGRKFYGDYLEELLQDRVSILQEENNHSTYQLDKTQVHFQAKADSEHFVTALASMFSKYMRELAMLSFNQYWEDRIPGLKHTAGYYQDGIRFLGELEKNSQLPADVTKIRRMK